MGVGLTGDSCQEIFAMRSEHSSFFNVVIAEASLQLLRFLELHDLEN